MCNRILLITIHILKPLGTGLRGLTTSRSIALGLYMVQHPESFTLQ